MKEINRDFVAMAILAIILITGVMWERDIAQVTADWCFRAPESHRCQDFLPLQENK